MKQITLLSLLTFMVSTINAQYKSTGTIERIDPAIDEIISIDSKIEIIAEGFEWSEGPLWIENKGTLLFSDIPRNTIYKWSEKYGTEVYLKPSGYTGTIQRGGETGSNGLLLNKNGQLVLCQHGDRQLAQMNSSLSQPKPDFTTIANTYKGEKFNSPNDATYNSKSELFFTDPPYGLEKRMKDPNKEIDFQGVYKIDTKGNVKLLIDSITRPNGIAFLPKEKQLIISNSDPEKPNWYIYNVHEDGSLSNGKIFYSTIGFDKKQKGLPDGLKIDSKGNIFATGPGGVWVFDKSGKLLGKIKLSDASSNCALSPDEKTLFITNHMKVLRLKMR